MKVKGGDKKRGIGKRGTIKNAGVENAGVENAGPSYGGGIVENARPAVMERRSSKKTRHLLHNEERSSTTKCRLHANTVT